MREKGFAPILILVGILITALAAGGGYYLTAKRQVKPKPAPILQAEIIKKKPIEATASSQTALESKKILPATPSSTPSSNRLSSAITILKNRLQSLSSGSAATPTLTPTSSPANTIAPTTTPTPTPATTSNPNCNNSDSKNTIITANSNGAIFSLSPANGAYKKGGDMAIQLNIDSKGRTIDALDALLQFDPAKLTVTSIVGKTGSYNKVVFPADTFDNSKGKIYLSMIDMGYTGMLSNSTPLTVINFKVNSSASGNAEVKFDFDPNDPTNTTDSNIIERNNMTDVLGSVTGGFYTIKPDGCN